MTLGKKMKLIRVKNDLTQAELSRKNEGNTNIY